MYNNYLKKTCLILLLFAIPLGCNWLFLFNSGELMPVEEIAERQLQSKEYSIVGLATRNQGYYYKKALYQRIQPKVLLLGSSRVMQFRDSFFKASMLSMGGAMNSLNEGFSLVQEILSPKAPEVIIWGLDYWWFNENLIKPSAEIKPPQELSHQISLRTYLLPFLWLWDKKISVREYLTQTHPRNLLKRDFSLGIGVDGILNRNGFAPDGSYFYTKTVVGKEKFFDEKFQHTLYELKSRNPLYPSKISEAHFQNFLKMLNYIKSRGAKVIIFIPPLAPTVVEELEKYHNTAKFIADLRFRLQQAGIVFYDFHHPQKLGGDCEFIDGVHGGDVLYAKILIKLAEAESDLKPYVNLFYLAHINDQLKNLAMVPQRQITSNPEIDFLGLGCNKSHQAYWTYQQNT